MNKGEKSRFRLRGRLFSISTYLALRTQPIHDTTNGGYFGKMYVGTNNDGKLAGDVSNDKEMRQGSLLGTLHIAKSASSWITKK
ncbi:hypothetical protein GC093_13010 [Paenibacillus sp. LMG 31456]|uniref:Uncharacterized protein n=2 Tax=Paenibacillus foliorum TaxID=2654974 RepID=A0A972GUN4_9BACL|nr:hypothetical protein [Paenibacillus foliorum]